MIVQYVPTQNAVVAFKWDGSNIQDVEDIANNEVEWSVENQVLRFDNKWIYPNEYLVKHLSYKYEILNEIEFKLKYTEDRSFY